MKILVRDQFILLSLRNILFDFFQNIIIECFSSWRKRWLQRMAARIVEIDGQW